MTEILLLILSGGAALYAFVLLLSWWDSRKLAKARDFRRIAPQGKVTAQNKGKPPPGGERRSGGVDLPSRVCPLCGANLDKHEYLWAAMGPEVPPGSKRKRTVQIYGCVRCFGGQGARRFPG